MKQNYSNYTDEDQRIWGILFERQIKDLPGIASDAYLEGVKSVGFVKDRIPNFDETNKILGRQTGWSLHVVPSIIPEKEFFELLSSKKFPATTWLRKMSQLDYLEEPDMFHDVFGHVPLLSNVEYCDFFYELSKIAMEHINSKTAITMLGRVYWFTVEFGLISENGKTKIYGAGILSSPGETRFCLGSEPKRLKFNVCEILTSPFENNRIQDKYYVIDSYAQLYNSLGEIRELLEQELEHEKIQIKNKI